MAKIIECVPNFSEGRQKEVIEAIATAIAATEGVSLLDVDPGVSTNRTVYTFVGVPEAVIEAALSGARCAYHFIDMTKHTGEHPRLGVLDVCPFIPVRNVTMEECIECARIFGERLAEELCIPVYLYAQAANEEHRKTLPQIRAGEYEKLPEKLKEDQWKPDFGPNEFVPNWGATVTGARNFLVAYNINCISTKEQCHRIALDIREAGRGPTAPGSLKNVQAIGWYLDEVNLAQVSANLTDFTLTGLHDVYEEVVKGAEGLNIPIVGSQIVGLTPLQAILNAAEYFMVKENLFILDEDQKIRLVIDRLGLNSLTVFNPKERIIEYMIQDNSDGPLISMSLKNFILNVGGRCSAPGGGSVAATIASLGAALGSMVGWMTYGSKKFESLDAEMRKLIKPMNSSMKQLMASVDDDTVAFTAYMEACKLPQTTPEEKECRDKKMQTCIEAAVEVPLQVARLSNSCWETMKRIAEIGNINTISDIQVGAKCLETGVWGAYYNVLINLKDIKDEEFVTKVKVEIDEAVKTAQENCEEVLKAASERQG